MHRHMLLLCHYRHTVSMPNVLLDEANKDNTLDYDDFTSTMAEVHTYII